MVFIFHILLIILPRKNKETYKWLIYVNNLSTGLLLKLNK